MSRTRKNSPELLAPAGNPEKAKIAFVFGADAVYLGVPDFSLRVRINYFNLTGIRKATAYAHKLGKKVYVTLNIFAHNKHLPKLAQHIKKLKQIQVDALIISDPGVLHLVQTEWPEAEIHLSTQANCINSESASFWQKQGVKRIILGREVTLSDIEKIKKKCPRLDLEYFVHGAMCMSYSGRCFLSKYFMDRSANLGDCVQPCRWRYFISEEKRQSDPLELLTDQHGSYILNSKDLCLIKYISDLSRAGVNHFKIEGRTKSIYYLATVTGAYKKAIDSGGDKKLLEFLSRELQTKLVNRGFSTGFLFGQKGEQNSLDSHRKSEWEFCGQVIEDSKKYKGESKFSTCIKVHNTIKKGDRIEIVKPFYDIIKLSPDRMLDAQTEKEIDEAHGGSKQKICLQTKEFLPRYSILRRIKK